MIIKETIVIATATSETVTGGVEGDARNQNRIDECVVGEALAYGLHDVEGTFGHVLTACVAAEFHRRVIHHTGQKDGLALGDKVIDKLMGENLVGQRVIGQDGTGISQFLSQTGYDGFGQRFQLGRRVLLLQTTNLTTKGFLRHRQSSALP